MPPVSPLPLTRLPALCRLALFLALGVVTACASSSKSVENAKSAFPGYDYVSHFVELPAGRMHYLDEGKGAPVVMLHGVPTWSYLWRDIIPHVSDSHRVLAPDMLNHGRSDKSPGMTFLDHYRNFEAFVDRLGLKDIVLVVHDWGSPVGFLYAARHPERVRAIAFFEAMLGPAPSLDAFPPVVKAMRSPDGHRLVVEENIFLEQILPQFVLHPLSDEVLAAYKQPFEHARDREQLLQWPREIPVMGDDSSNLSAFGEYAQFLATSELPKLLIHADPGVLTPKDAVDFARSTYKNLKIEFIGPGGHFLQEDASAPLGDALSGWLNGL